MTVQKLLPPALAVCAVLAMSGPALSQAQDVAFIPRVAESTIADVFNETCVLTGRVREVDGLKLVCDTTGPKTNWYPMAAIYEAEPHGDGWVIRTKSEFLMMGREGPKVVMRDRNNYPMDFLLARTIVRRAAEAADASVN